MDYGKIYVPGTNREERTYDTVSDENSWGCGGLCVYEWQVNCNPHIDGNNVCLIPQSGIVGPIKHCSQGEAILFNSWITSENLGECVSITDDKVIKMSYFVQLTKEQCGCAPAKYCPDWQGESPGLPSKSFLPLCEGVHSPPALSVTNNLPEFGSKIFRLLDESKVPAEPSDRYIELYVDEEGWPIELNFPEEAFKNGSPDPDSDAYKDTVASQSPPFEHLTVVFYDQVGKGWIRAGYFLPK